MDEMMEPKIGLYNPDDEQLRVEEPIAELNQLSDQVRAHINKVDEVIEQSKRKRGDLNFSHEELSKFIRVLNEGGAEDSTELLKLVAEKLQCESRAIFEVNKNESGLIIYDYAYDSVESWEASDGYRLYEKLKDGCENIADNNQRQERRRLLKHIENEIVSPLRRYYEELQRRSYDDSSVDVVILYDSNHYDHGQALLNELTEMEQYTVEAFKMDGNTTRNDPRLVAAMHLSTLMIHFCESREDGEKKFRAKQYMAMSSKAVKKILFITDSIEEQNDIPLVSIGKENWISEANKKVSVLINNGAASKKELVESLTEREEEIQSFINRHGRSVKEIDNLMLLIDEQRSDIENYRTLYHSEPPCRYYSGDLDAIEARYSGEQQSIDSNVNRWLGKMIRDNKAINKIVNNETPEFFYERYMQLCKLIDAQQEHRDRLLATGMTLDELSKRLEGVEIDRLTLHAKRWEYQKTFKRVILNAYMKPFDKEFANCRAIDSIKPLKIDSHIENFEKFEACGIYLNKDDGLTYWTKRAFNHALNEKKHDQILINSQLERITDMSSDIEHFVRDYINPTFSADVLNKKAEQLKGLVKSFEDTWGLKLVNKKPIYGGYNGKMCFAKYVDKDLLSRDVSEAIELNNNGNLGEFIREFSSRGTNSAKFCDLGYSFYKQFRESRDADEKNRLIALANEYLKKAADMGDRKAQYRLASNYEKGYGLTQNMDIALTYYKMSAENNYTDAQYKLARYYENIDENTARDWYEKAAGQKSHPSFDACIYLGYDYAKKDKVEDKKQAVKYFLLAKDNMPKEGENRKKMYGYLPCYLLGMEFMGNKNYSEAIEWFGRIRIKEVEGKKERNFLPTVYCGDCYLMLGKRKEAVEEYSSLDSDKLPDDRKIVVADYLLENNHTEDAYKYYIKCKNVDTDPSLRSRVGDCYLANKNFDGAVEIYKRCIEETESSGDEKQRSNCFIIKKKLADVLYDHYGDKHAEALGYYLNYLEEIPFDEVVLERIGDCYLKAGERNLAYEYYLKCENSITDADKLSFIAEMHIGEGKNEVAFDLLDRLYSTHGGRLIPVAIIDYVRDYNRWDDFTTWYSEYGCTLPDESLLLDIGKYYHLKGDGRAAECYEKYAIANTVNDTAIIGYMIRYYKAGDDQERLAEWMKKRKALRLL